MMTGWTEGERMKDLALPADGVMTDTEEQVQETIRIMMQNLTKKADGIEIEMGARRIRGRRKSTERKRTEGIITMVTVRNDTRMEEGTRERNGGPFTHAVVNHCFSLLRAAEVISVLGLISVCHKVLKNDHGML